MDDVRTVILRCPGCGEAAHAAIAFDPIVGPPPESVLVSTATGHTASRPSADPAAQHCRVHGLWRPHYAPPHVDAARCAAAAELCDQASSHITWQDDPAFAPLGASLAALLDEAAAGWRRCANVARDGLPTMAADPVLRRAYVLARAVMANRAVGKS